MMAEILRKLTEALMPREVPVAIPESCDTFDGLGEDMMTSFGARNVASGPSGDAAH